MTLRALWLPGGWLSTNELLAMQRSTGFYHGVRSATRGRRNAGGDPVHSFGHEVKRMRHTVAMEVRRRKWPQFTKPVGLVFELYGHGRYDPSAWYLAAKAAEDGLRDAGAIAGDRFGVAWTAGQVIHEGQARLCESIVGPDGPGMLLLVKEASCGLP